MVKVIKWTCPTCGKVIESIYEEQMTTNVRAHELTHKKKEVTNEQGTGPGF